MFNPKSILSLIQINQHMNPSGAAEAVVAAAAAVVVLPRSNRYFLLLHASFSLFLSQSFVAVGRWV